MITQKDLERFWSKVDKRGEEECWEWLSEKNKTGYEYGRFRFSKKKWLAHRFSWLIHNGIIPPEILVLHMCDNPGCVNPGHLFLGTHKDNSQDAVKKGHFPNRNGEASNSSKLTEKQVLIIRDEYQYHGRNNIYVLGRKYGVNPATIQYIVTRKTWRHI